MAPSGLDRFNEGDSGYLRSLNGNVEVVPLTGSLRGLHFLVLWRRWDASLRAVQPVQPAR